MKMIENNSVVEIKFTLTDTQGKILDTASKEEPLRFIQGTKNMLPILEKKLSGKRVGDNLKVEVSPSDGYGEYNKSLLQVVSKKDLGEENIEVGMKFQAQDNNENVIVVTATKVDEKNVTFDGNHPLAGEVLNFDIDVLSIRKASKEELKNATTPQESKSCSCC